MTGLNRACEALPLRRRIVVRSVVDVGEGPKIESDFVAVSGSKAMPVSRQPIFIIRPSTSVSIPSRHSKALRPARHFSISRISSAAGASRFDRSEASRSASVIGRCAAGPRSRRDPTSRTSPKRAQHLRERGLDLRKDRRVEHRQLTKPDVLGRAVARPRDTRPNWGVLRRPRTACLTPKSRPQSPERPRDETAIWCLGSSRRCAQG